jgi:hypothetical protein
MLLDESINQNRTFGQVVSVASHSAPVAGSKKAHQIDGLLVTMK